MFNFTMAVNGDSILSIFYSGSNTINTDLDTDLNSIPYPAFLQNAGDSGDCDQMSGPKFQLFSTSKM